MVINELAIIVWWYFLLATTNCIEHGEHASNKTHRVYLDENEYEYKCDPPNTTFDIFCDSQCSCLSGGRVGNCTLTTKGCNGWRDEEGIPVYLEEETNREEFQCIPESRILVECNLCWCNSEGKVGMCTLMGCLSWDKWREYSA